MPEIDLTISIASWNTRDLLRDCLSSLYKHTRGIRFEVIVVDNASGDSSVEMVKREFPGVKLIVNQENVGFSRAHNWALKTAVGRFFLVLNSDTFIVDDSFSRMVAFLDVNSSAGACAPQMLNPDRTVQPNRFHILRPLEAFLSITNLYSYSWDYKYLQGNETREVEMLGGACIMMRRPLFEEMGGFDERLCMYNEEHDLAIRIRKAGYKLFYFPDAKLCHYIGASAGKQDNYKMLSDTYRSNIYYYRKYFPRMIFWYLKATYCLIFFLMILRNLGFMLLGKDHSLHRSRNKTLLKLLWET